MANRYIASTFVGFESICEEELQQKIPNILSTRILPQKVVFTSNCQPSSIVNIKSATRIMALCAEIKSLPLDVSALQLLHDYGETRIDWTAPLQLFYQQFPGITKTDHQFRVSCERRGLGHAYKSPEAAAQLGAGTFDQMKGTWKVNLKNFNTEIILEIDDGIAVVGLVLQGDLNRRNRHSHAWKTALNCSFAYCLARSMRVQPGQRVCDPMGGIGTILIETQSALEWPHCIYLCGDVDLASVEVARSNSIMTGAKVDFFVWDTTRLPFASSSLDIMVSDMPFGHRHGSFRQNQSLYPRTLHEWHRVLKVDGMAYLVTTERGIMKRYLQSHNTIWKIISSTVVDVGGFNAELYVLQHRVSFLDMAVVMKQTDFAAIPISISSTMTLFTNGDSEFSETILAAAGASPSSGYINSEEQTPQLCRQNSASSDSIDCIGDTALTISQSSCMAISGSTRLQSEHSTENAMSLASPCCVASGTNLTAMPPVLTLHSRTASTSLSGSHSQSGNATVVHGSTPQYNGITASPRLLPALVLCSPSLLGLTGGQHAYTAHTQFKPNLAAASKRGSAHQTPDSVMSVATPNGGVVDMSPITLHTHVSASDTSIGAAATNKHPLSARDLMQTGSLPVSEVLVSKKPKLGN